MDKTSYVIKATSIHGDKYGYDNLPDNFNVTDEINIFCKTCGRYFSSIARNHTNNNSGCKYCAKEEQKNKIRKDFDYFINKAKLKHNDKFIYFREKYIDMSTPTDIQCKQCGNIFPQKPSLHVLGNGCPICNPFPKRLTTEQFKNQLKKEHPNLELISEYNGNKKDVIVKCKIHNYSFHTTPNRLHAGNGCKLCYDDRRGDKTRKPLEQLKEEIRLVHGDKYDLDKIEYINNKTDITLTCPKHGDFNINPLKLLSGQGCNECNNSKLEEFISIQLKSKNILFEREKKFDWLKHVSSLSLDYYIPKCKLAIECQGIQHFKPIMLFGGEKSFNKQIENDKIKFDLCKKNNIQLIYLIDEKSKNFVTEYYNDKIVLSTNEIIGYITNSFLLLD